MMNTCECMYTCVWACLWLSEFAYGNSNSSDPVTPFIVSQLTRGVKGADEGRCGGSQGTMRLESKAAASTNRQRDWVDWGVEANKSVGVEGGFPYSML